MVNESLPSVGEKRRLPSPAPAPQALTWHQGRLWMGSRDLSRIYEIDVAQWKVVRDMATPGKPWAAVSTGDSIRFTIGEGSEDDRYIHRFTPDRGFSDRLPCP